MLKFRKAVNNYIRNRTYFCTYTTTDTLISSFTDIQRYYNGTNKRIDMDVPARLCHALECRIEDIIEYRE